MSKRSIQSSLMGLVFCITGTLSVPRAEFEAFINENGGTVAGTVTKAVTHLVSAETGTKKCKDAEAKGVTIVNEQWVRDKVGGGGSTVGSSKSTAVVEPPKKQAKVEATATATKGPALGGMVIAVTGTLSVPRAEFEAFIVEHGGVVAKSVTNKCTHLVSAETGTKKCEDAEAKGVTIVNEDWIRNLTAGATASGSNVQPIAANIPAAPAAKGKAKGKAAAKKGGDDEDDNDSDGGNEKADAAAGSNALEGLCFAITGTLTVPRAQFESLITKNGGTIAKTVSNKCTHLVSSETGTKKCLDAMDKGVSVVDEQWVRTRIINGSFTGERSNVERPYQYTPNHDYIDEIIDVDEDEGRLDYSEGKKNIGKLIFSQSDDYDDENKEIYKVISCKTIDDEMMFTIRNIKDKEDEEEINVDELCDCYYTLPPTLVINRWERYQNRRIAEGVWSAKANQTLHNEINRLVDAFAAAESEDYHPGTNNVVRDLVHPSLYPLIINADDVDTAKRNYFNRPYEKSRFQWLPTEVAVDKIGGVQFTSPINNLDTDKYPDLKHSLEMLFAEMIPGFEKVWTYAKKVTFTEQHDSNWPDNYPEVPPVSFRGANLQAVVKIADYHFAPGATFNGVWHYEGMSHENIVMTGLFYPGSDDRLGGGLEFQRQFTDVEANKVFYGLPQCRPPWTNDDVSNGFVPLGWTTTETGKMMVFPNCHAHRVMEMINNTAETLRRRLVVFFVVDPDRRIASSKDHPPMPRQVSLEQALADRLELMQERKQAKQALNPREIELCEH